MPYASSIPLFTTLLLSSLTSVVAAPFPKGGGGHGGGGGGHGSSGGHGSGSSSSSGDNKPLSAGVIAGIVIGVFFGCILVFGIAFICTNIDWCIKKEYEFYDWRARRKAKKEGRERGYQVQNTQDDAEVKGDVEGDVRSESDEGWDGDEATIHARESESEEEYTDARAERYGESDEERLKVPV